MLEERVPSMLICISLNFSLPSLGFLRVLWDSGGKLSKIISKY